VNSAHLLGEWLAARLSPEAMSWLRAGMDRLASDGTDADLYRTISLVARKIGKTALALSDAELARADSVRPGWNPSAWATDQSARLVLLLSVRGPAEDFVRRLDALCATADVGELVAFYQGLPLYPDPPRHVLRAAEGVRTNMKVVFESVAHRNPYPSEQFDEIAWNQMVLKALFVGSTLDPIVGLDRRANAALAGMLRDYAHERWSAQRPVSPELWRCIGPFARGDALADLERVLASSVEAESLAAALALSASSDPDAQRLLDRKPDAKRAIAAGQTTWRQFAPQP
jgi:hypothetical protein